MLKLRSTSTRLLPSTLLPSTLLTAALVAAMASSALADPFSFTQNTTVTDDDEVPIASSLTVGPGEAGLINDLNVTINATVDWPGEVDIVLTHTQPVTLTTTAVTLASNGDTPNSAPPGAFTDTFFDDGAGTAISAGTNPFIGSFRPFQALSAFNGLNVYGTWTLSITDTIDDGGATHSINSFQLTGSFNPAPIPEPGTYALFGLGALGLAGLVRRRRKAAATKTDA